MDGCFSGSSTSDEAAKARAVFVVPRSMPTTNGVAAVPVMGRVLPKRSDPARRCAPGSRYITGKPYVGWVERSEAHQRSRPNGLVVPEAVDDAPPRAARVVQH